jgi:transcriptional regulator with PAS, ATPase and Fis domain
MHFIEKFAAQYHKPIRGMAQRARIMLARHSWPGNVRELENVIGHACMMVLGDMIDAKDLPDYLRTSNRDEPIQSPVPNDSGSFEEHEKRLVTEALSRAEGNQSKAARELQIGRDALRYKMKKHGLL